MVYFIFSEYLQSEYHYLFFSRKVAKSFYLNQYSEYQKSENPKIIIYFSYIYHYNTQFLPNFSPIFYAMKKDVYRSYKFFLEDLLFCEPFITLKLMVYRVVHNEICLIVLAQRSRLIRLWQRYSSGQVASNCHHERVFHLHILFQQKQ